MFYRMKKEKLITISLVTQLSKEEGVRVLVILILDLLFQTFLKIFLVKMFLALEEERGEEHRIEVMI